jgi:phenylalanyl-tRNA synthetase beta chain
MKISLNWLQDFVELKEKNVDVIAETITRSTGEVDDVEVQGRLLTNCAVGKILKLEKHPNADKLTLCEVQTDKGVKKIVCGGSNLREGMKVAVAHVGAEVKWHGGEMVKLERTKIRGEESQGMICAAEELELSELFPAKDSHEVVDLGDGDEGVGKDLREYLGLTDTVLHIDNHAITHRADLFSHVGFARELVALGLATWKKPRKPTTFSFTSDDLPFRFINDIPDLIPRYCSCVIGIDDLGETPDWMKKRLEATGWRSINPPIDITNYVTMELGMPMHSFDADDLKGDVHARTAKEGEKIRTLDAIERVLPEGAIVLADDVGIFDLLGVMGGLRSSTKSSTRKIYLHSAAVDPVSIRKTIIATGHRTDASTVYEKGVPLSAVQAGFDRALGLFLELVPGATILSKEETWGTNGERRTIPFSTPALSRILGSTIPTDTAKKILSDLGCMVTEKKIRRSKEHEAYSNFDVSVPLWRNDLKTEQDIAEEVGRIYGYDKIEPQMPAEDLTPPHRDHRMKMLREALKNEGYTELLPLSLTGKATLEKCAMDPATAVAIDNPLGEELGLLHTSTLPALLEHAERNAPQGGDCIKTFHWGHVFRKTDNGHTEHPEITVFYAQLKAPAEGSALREDPSLQLKRDVLSACHAAGYHPHMTEATSHPPFAHPGRSADVMLHDRRLGMLYEVHPIVRENFGLHERVAALTINLDTLFANDAFIKVPRALPQFPATSYDETLETSQDKAAGEALKRALGTHPLLESIQTVDLYKGPQHENLSYNLTIRCTYRAADRTLTEKEAESAHGEVMNALKKELALEK